LPTFTNLVAPAALGAIVGGVKVLNRDQPVLSVPMPMVAALIVSALVFLAIRYGTLKHRDPKLVSYAPRNRPSSCG
jgi:hypothetical protein